MAQVVQMVVKDRVEYLRDVCMMLSWKCWAWGTVACMSAQQSPGRVVEKLLVAATDGDDSARMGAVQGDTLSARCSC